ncbi:tachylectin-related carbohydrate-binding protein [Actinokineospora diospyrosa]|uniref:Tachylectin n=1 Tax=Actinokineospora diospyrosa TaxID=103728 RepID=A0ABT1IGB5_9PSEU|nr:tachylectin-related carbohydrate-binding protein [Actinokineospora diospyrosa]MCP2271665.1 Tachylectin [Actinokineospora diospyrosa]
MSLAKYAAALLTALTLTTGLANTTAQAAPISGPQCSGPADVFGFEEDGDLFTYPHNSPLTGAANWGAKRYIGTGWNKDNSLVGPDGAIFTITPSGELRRYQWNGDHWQTYAGSTQYQVVGHGFDRYLRNGGMIATTDADYGLYFVEGDALRKYQWSANEGGWTPATAHGPVIGTGWSGVDKIVGGGSGVIYGRQAGTLTRSVHVQASGTWTQRFQPVGAGWQSLPSITSAGADVLYATDYSGGLYWYRYEPATGKWVSDKGTMIGYGWNTVTTLADPRSCVVWPT